MNYTLTVLKEARRLLVDVGWTQGSYKRYDVCVTENGSTCEPIAYCAIGAVSTAAGLVPYSDSFKNQDAIVFLKNAMPPSARSKNDSGGSIIKYNDRKGRSKKRIIQLFDDAIKLAEEQEL